MFGLKVLMEKLDNVFVIIIKYDWKIINYSSVLHFVAVFKVNRKNYKTSFHVVI